MQILKLCAISNSRWERFQLIAICRKCDQTACTKIICRLALTRSTMLSIFRSRDVSFAWEGKTYNKNKQYKPQIHWCPLQWSQIKLEWHISCSFCFRHPLLDERSLEMCWNVLSEIVCDSEINKICKGPARAPLRKQNGVKTHSRNQYLEVRVIDCLRVKALSDCWGLKCSEGVLQCNFQQEKWSPDSAIFLFLLGGFQARFHAARFPALSFKDEAVKTLVFLNLATKMTKWMKERWGIIILERIKLLRISKRNCGRYCDAS